METDERHSTRHAARRSTRAEPSSASGGLTVAADAVRDQRGVPWLESVAADLTYAMRALRHSPAFTRSSCSRWRSASARTRRSSASCAACCSSPCRIATATGSSTSAIRSTDRAATNVSFSVPEVRDFRTGTTILAGIAEYSPWFGTLRQEAGAAPASTSVSSPATSSTSWDSRRWSAGSRLPPTTAKGSHP